MLCESEWWRWYPFYAESVADTEPVQQEEDDDEVEDLPGTSDRARDSLGQGK